jgi:L-amino acid N-acyltransferase YncA
MSHQLTFNVIKEEDYFAIKEIYDYYIIHSTVTFHTEPITIHDLKEFVFSDNQQYPAYLIFCDDVVAGYGYLTYYKKRQAYNRTAEITIYLKPEFCDKGLGHKVATFIENEAKKRNIKNLIAIITANNYPSIKLFEKCGYKKCAHFKNIGEKQGQVLDVVAYQKEI